MGFLGGPIFPLTKDDSKLHEWHPWKYNTFEEGAPLTREKHVGLDAYQYRPYGGNPDYKDTLYKADDYEGAPYELAPWIYQEIPNTDPRTSGVQASLPDRVNQFLATV